MHELNSHICINSPEYFVHSGKNIWYRILIKANVLNGQRVVILHASQTQFSAHPVSRSPSMFVCVWYQVFTCFYTDKPSIGLKVRPTFERGACTTSTQLKQSNKSCIDKESDADKRLNCQPDANNMHKELRTSMKSELEVYQPKKSLSVEVIIHFSRNISRFPGY